jgi:hypothetical protein
MVTETKLQFSKKKKKLLISAMITVKTRTEMASPENYTKTFKQQQSQTHILHRHYLILPSLP